MKRDDGDEVLEDLFTSLRGLHIAQVRSAWKLRPKSSQAALEAIARGGSFSRRGGSSRPAWRESAESVAKDAQGIAVSDLARLLHSSLPATSRLLGTMEKRGLIVRSSDPADRRKTLVTLTDAGDRERIEGRELFLEYARLIADDFGDKRLEAFSAEAKRLAEAMQDALAAMEERHPDQMNGDGEACCTPFSFGDGDACRGTGGE